MNESLKKYAKSKGVKLWEIADRLGMADSNFSRMLRYELSAEKSIQIKQIIEDIAKSRI